jgi:hypothetical protein
MHIPLLTDQALGESELKNSDGLGFKTYASVLANAALGTPGPFTIGVFGEWGNGKTSLMRMTESNLKKSPHVITVWFNAWRYEKEEHPIVPLVGTIVRELELHQTFLADLKDQGKKLLRALRAVAYGFSAKSTVKLPGLAEVEASFVAKEMIDREKQLTPDPLLDRSLYYQAFETLSSVELPEKARIVVLIDDLDRCFPDHAVRLLESIKLVLCQKGFVFVLGVARRVIEGFLQHRYQTEYGILNFQGSAYLDKIVQLPFTIPPHQERMKKFSESLLEQIEPSIGKQLSDILPAVAEALGGNPRAVIRFVNNVLIDLAINAELAKTEAMEKIPAEYFAVSRCLQQRWPDVYNILTTFEETAKEVASWKHDQMQKIATTEANDYSGKVAMAKALAGDRDLQRLLQSKTGITWLKEAGTRNATVHFLRTQRREVETPPSEARADYDVFLSYSVEDREKVSELVKHLVANGVRVFWDNAVRPGEDVSVALERGIRRSSVVAFCISENTRESKGAMRELEMAMTRLKSRVIPIILPGSSPRYVPIELRKLQWLDMSSGFNKDSIFSLIQAVKNWSELNT